MASRIASSQARMLMSSRARVVAYLPSLSAVVRHFRAYSSHDEQPTGRVFNAHALLDDAPTAWPDSHLGPFAPENRTFPLPGMVAPAHQGKPAVRATAAQPELPQLAELLTDPTAQDRHLSVLGQLMNTSQQWTEAENKKCEEKDPSGLNHLECVAQDCPQILRKDFQSLFPERNLLEGPLTIICISQKTEADMSGWSPDVEVEREHLLEQFVSGAQDICEALHAVGYWADFIDPSSGRPYLGAYTNATLYETDERYRNFGYEIEDLGCCKVIRHHLWGTHAYVGSLFTTAPLDHPVLRELVQKNPEQAM